MSLQEMVTGVRRLDDSVVVLELDNDFAVGYELGSEDAKFAAISNLGGTSELPFGDNARFVSNGDYASFSMPAKRTLEDFANSMDDPISFVKSQLEGMYHKILEPISIRPVHKRNLGYALPIIGLTLTYPISAPLTYLFHRAKGVQYIDGVHILATILAIPFQFPEAVKELTVPSKKGLRITNKEIFSEKPEGDDHVGISTFFGELNSDLFGDPSSVPEGEDLSVFFPDGLELSGGHAFYPEIGSRYSSAKHFLKIDGVLIDRVYSLREQEEQIWSSWRKFSDSLNHEEVGAILKTLEAR